MATEHLRGRLGVALLAALSCALPSAARADMPSPAHAFPTTREGDAGLPGHTVFHPADLSAPGFRLPIVVWGNGGCRNSNEEFRYFLTNFASYGFFVVANGPPENPYHPEELDGIASPNPQLLIDAIDWAIKENARPASKYHDRLDPDRVAIMGQSCGGWEGIDASSDPRVTSTVAWNNGTTPPHGGDVTKLHAPILFVAGGQEDYTIQFTLAGYTATPAGVPAVYANHATAGHTGLWDDPSPGVHSPLQDEPLLVGSQWLALTLYGQPAARQFFLAQDCGLCNRQDWSVQTKSWDAFKREPSQAPAAVGAQSPAVPAECTGRTITVHPRRSLARAVIYVDGRRRATLRGRRQIRRGARVKLTGTRVTVRIVGRTHSGRRVTAVRRYSACR